uniref:HipA N-terminal subdomain 1 domain-containing protein n=1 Tax=Aliivibrio fischeri TaxID=668 RepID=H2ERT1_ALIFS|nr:HipA N-terminal domain-containing protein [Aliivibrio fischeri]AEY78098.1 hypothetical protein [Aliivibrio fischeri]
MDRKVKVFLYNHFAGVLTQKDNIFTFTYNDSYRGKPLSLSFPLAKNSFTQERLHPFFASLAPEGWLKKRYSDTQKIDENDTLGMLIQNGNNLIGAVRLERFDN